jgi:hypothetical protein
VDLPHALGEWSCACQRMTDHGAELHEGVLTALRSGTLIMCCGSKSSCQPVMQSCRGTDRRTFCRPLEADKELAHLVVDQCDLVVGHESGMSVLGTLSAVTKPLP